MTLLGVGSGAGALAGNTTTLGRIGTGFMYADWKAQVAYTSPNFNGFQFTAGVTQAFDVAEANSNAQLGAQGAVERGGKEPAFEGKASYSFAADAVTGKVWASAISQNVEQYNKTSSAWDLGANVNAAGFGLTGYYGEGRGLGTAVQFNAAYDASGNKRKSDDWYVQATYALPGVGTKLGASYGESTLKATGSGDAGLNGKNLEDSMWVVGVYHPITKHLNLVAEYSDAETQLGTSKGTAKTMSAGAILFF
jgi:predicted porin